MYLPSPTVIGIAFGLSEAAISLTLRVRGNAQSKDQHSLAVIWIVILAGLGVAIWLGKTLPDATLPWPQTLYPIGLTLFVVGVALRWWSIETLGRFFTVQVAIHSDHQLIQKGPYRYLRHPSYTGALFAFIGFSLCFGNWPAMIALLAPVLVVFAWRIRIEEAALAEAFGEQWRDYVSRTWRLLPLVY